jgi:hypothetical protein
VTIALGAVGDGAVAQAQSDTTPVRSA